MSSNAFPRLEREYNERESRLEEIRSRKTINGFGPLDGNPSNTALENWFPYTAEELERLKREAARYRFLRKRCRARWDDSEPDEPQIVYHKRSNPYLNGYADRMDAAIDAAMTKACHLDR